MSYPASRRRFEETLERLQRGEIPSGELREAILVLGKHYDEQRFERAKPFIAPLLSHPDDDVRSEAVWCLGLWWQCPEFESQFVDALLQDPDEEVRWSAADSLGKIKRGSKDQHLLTLLAAVVKNAEEDGIVRASAYTAMLEISGRMTGLETAALPIDIDEFQSIDWPWVESLASSQS